MIGGEPLLRLSFWEVAFPSFLRAPPRSWAVLPSFLGGPRLDPPLRPYRSPNAFVALEGGEATSSPLAGRARPPTHALVALEGGEAPSAPPAGRARPRTHAFRGEGTEPIKIFMSNLRSYLGFSYGHRTWPMAMDMSYGQTYLMATRHVSSARSSFADPPFVSHISIPQSRVAS